MSILSVLSLALSLLLTCGAAHATDIKKISSVFTQLDGKPSEPNVGGSYVVRYKGKNFLVTASHLSRGGSKLQTAHAFRDSLADPDADLEVFLVDDSARPLAEYREFDGMFAATPEYRDELLARRKSGDSLLQVANRSFIPKGDWIGQSTRGWKPKSALVHTGLAADNLLGDLLDGATPGELYAPTQIDGGTSGHPLFHLAKIAEEPGGAQSRGFLLAGTAIRSDRFFDGSVYAHVGELRKLLERFEKGERGQVGKTEWRMREGETYRFDPVLGLEEAVFCSPTAPIGRGYQGDRGRGSQGDRGTGTQGDRGGQESGACLKAGVGFGGNAMLGFWDANGKAVYADYSVIRDSLLRGEKIRPIRETDSLVQLALRRERSDGRGGCTLEILAGERANLNLRVFNPELRDFESVHLEFSLKTSEFQPIVKRRTPKGAGLRVDLRGLLFDRYKEFIPEKPLAPNSDSQSISHVRIGIPNAKYHDSPLACGVRAAPGAPASPPAAASANSPVRSGN